MCVVRGQKCDCAASEACEAPPVGGVRSVCAKNKAINYQSKRNYETNLRMRLEATVRGVCGCARAFVRGWARGAAATGIRAAATGIQVSHTIERVVKYYREGTGAAAAGIKHDAFHGTKRLLGRVDLEEVLIHHRHHMGSAHDRHCLFEELAPLFVHVQRNHSTSRHRP